MTSAQKSTKGKSSKAGAKPAKNPPNSAPVKAAGNGHGKGKSLAKSPKKPFNKPAHDSQQHGKPQPTKPPFAHFASVTKSAKDKAAADKLNKMYYALINSIATTAKKKADKMGKLKVPTNSKEWLEELSIFLEVEALKLTDRMVTQAKKHGLPFIQKAMMSEGHPFLEHLREDTGLPASTINDEAVSAILTLVLGKFFLQKLYYGGRYKAVHGIATSLLPEQAKVFVRAAYPGSPDVAKAASKS